MAPVSARIHHTLNLLSKSSWRKWSNALKVLLSYYQTKVTGNPVHGGFPISLSMEPTTACNLRCPECPSGLRSFTRPTGMMTMELFEKVIDEMEDYLFYLTLYFQGEPFLNPNFYRMVNYAHQRKIYTATSTNGHFLRKEQAIRTVESGLDKLIISLDGSSQETYSHYRIGGRIEKVLAGASTITETREQLKTKNPYTIFQCLVVRQNEHQLDEIKRLAREMGIDKVVFKTAQIYNYEYGSDLIPQNSKYSRYEPLGDGRYRLKNSLKDECWRMWHSCVVTWDGRIVPCCFDKDATHQFGDASKESLKSIWQNTAYRTFRNKLFQSRKAIDICSNCTEGTKVWA
jgi:radical SAM protein with 4Fe4S-binding SPASM domain